MRSLTKEKINYLASWDRVILRDCQTLLEFFDCCEELRKDIDEYITYVDAIMEAEIGIRRTKALAKQPCKKLKEIIEEHPLVHEVGVCPKCNAALLGTPVPECESKKTGRLFYRECKNCDYYSELFKTKTGVEEREGD